LEFTFRWQVRIVIFQSRQIDFISNDRLKAGFFVDRAVNVAADRGLVEFVDRRLGGSVLTPAMDSFICRGLSCAGDGFCSSNELSISL
jgi:hypothetical protein